VTDLSSNTLLCVASLASLVKNEVGRTSDWETEVSSKR